MMESKTSDGCKLVIVEGNISAGKSTLCRMLSEELGYVLYLEPTVENPFLGPYYKEPKKYALPMQLWLLKQRFVTYLKAIKYSHESGSETRGVILDRSIWSDIVFAEKNFLDGNISSEGYAYYLELRAKLLSGLPDPHGVIYLDASPEVCFDRIHKMRQRECEDGIPLEYLAGLDTCYKNFVKGMSSTRAGVMEVDWNTFGSAAAVIKFIEALPAPPLADWVGDITPLQTLIKNPASVVEAMKMPYSIDEAGADIEVADPDWITTKEVRVMPTSPGSSTAKRPAPLDDEDEDMRTPEGQPAKTRRLGATPTTVAITLDMDEGVRPDA